jgi:hypothetical protein
MDQTLSWFFRPATEAAEHIRTGPDRRALSSPVFIQDAVTPWADGTLLLDQLRRQQAQDQEDE